MGYCERKKEKIDAGFRLFIKFQSREDLIHFLIFFYWLYLSISFLHVAH